MNNKKWFKLFLFFSKHEVFQNKFATIKVVWEKNNERRFHIPKPGSEYFDFYDNGLEGLTEGFSRWCFYEEIEWLKFPKEFLSNRMSRMTHEQEVVVEHQDINMIFEFLEKLPFQIDAERSEDHIKIYAYKVSNK